MQNGCVCTTKMREMGKRAKRLKQGDSAHQGGLWHTHQESLCIREDEHLCDTNADIWQYSFSEFRKAYIYNSIDGPVRCCKIDDETVRKEDGENDLPMPGETVVEDGEAVINGTTLQRPYSWYQINPNDSSFAPKNCDQLPLHIIRFMLMKLMDAEANVQHGGLLGWIYDFLRDMINRIRGIFGTMNTEELKQIIGRMQRSGLIKDTGDGIEIIKRF